MTDINSIEVGSYKRNVEKWLHAMFLTLNDLKSGAALGCQNKTAPL